MSALKTFVGKELADFTDDETKVAALFKAFSGQPSDWQHRLEFWKALIVKVARHLHAVVVDSDDVLYQWFQHGGLLPLCINDVLVEMVKTGEMQRLDELKMTNHSRLKRILSGARNVLGWAGRNLVGSPTSNVISGKLVVSILLKERVEQLIDVLANTHWKSECVVTKNAFVNYCDYFEDAEAVMHHLMLHCQAYYFRCNCSGDEHIEGLKISMDYSSVSPVSQVDHYMLQLFWTNETLEERYKALEQRMLELKQSAAFYVKNGDKEGAMRCLKCSRILSFSKAACSNMISRVQETVNLISDRETTKMVAEAVRIGNLAMKQHHVTLEEVNLLLKEMDESIAHQKKIEQAIGNAGEVEEDDGGELEDEYANLCETEIFPQVPTKPPFVPRLEEQFSKLQVV